MAFKPNQNLSEKVKQKLEVGLDRAAIVLQNKVKDNLSGPKTNKKLGVRTGNLRRIQIDRSGISNLTVRVGTNNTFYARIHEFGGVIKAKTAKFLSFKIGGKWRSKKSVIIPARPYFRPAIKSSKKKMLKQFKDLL